MSLTAERIMTYLLWLNFFFLLLQTEGGVDQGTKDTLAVFEAVFLAFVLLEYMLSLVYACRGGLTTGRFAVDWVQGSREKRAAVGVLVHPLKVVDLLVVIAFVASDGTARLGHLLLLRTQQDNHPDSSLMGDKTGTYKVFSEFWNQKKHLLLVTTYLFFTMWVLVSSLNYLVGGCWLL